MEKPTVYYHADPFEIIHLKNRPMSYSKHTHTSVYTVGLILAGTIILETENQRQEYHTNGFFVIPPYQIHALTLSQEYEFVVICIPKHVVSAYTSTQMLYMLAERLGQLFQQAQFPALTEAAHVLNSFENGPLDGSPIYSTIEKIQNEPEAHSSIQNLAGTACYCRSHFFTLFKQATGMTPHKFQLQSRVRKAQRLIEHGAGLSALAANLGFYDQSHFIKCFKDMVGFTPSEYKQSVKRLL